LIHVEATGARPNLRPSWAGRPAHSINVNTPIPEDKLSAIRDALVQRRKIEAIKIYRKTAGVGLAEAKSAVENLEQELRQKSPEKFIALPERKGCLGWWSAVACWLSSRSGGKCIDESV